jgi:hypothetical protein
MRTHTIRGAFAFMEDEEKVRRTGWKESYLTMNKERTTITEHFNVGGGKWAQVEWEPSHDDIVAKDWEMVD